jgi:hypothetical protein
LAFLAFLGAVVVVVEVATFGMGPALIVQVQVVVTAKLYLPDALNGF